MSPKPNRSTRELLKRHYSEKQLDQEQLNALFEMQLRPVSLPADAVPPTRYWWRIRPLQALALTACMVVFVASLWGVIRPVSDNRELIEEIASNHLQPLQLDVDSSSLESVGRSLNHLSFSLIESDRLPSSEWALLGGRYCSIQGQLAAQLRFLDKQSQKIVTLYQSVIPFKNYALFSDETLLSEAGVEVSIWREDGVMLALAQ